MTVRGERIAISRSRRTTAWSPKFTLRPRSTRRAGRGRIDGRGRATTRHAPPTLRAGLHHAHLGPSSLGERVRGPRPSTRPRPARTRVDMTTRGVGWRTFSVRGVDGKILRRHLIGGLRKQESFGGPVATRSFRRASYLSGRARPNARNDFHIDPGDESSTSSRATSPCGASDADGKPRDTPVREASMLCRAGTPHCRSAAGHLGACHRAQAAARRARPARVVLRAVRRQAPRGDVLVREHRGGAARSHPEVQRERGAGTCQKWRRRAPRPAGPRLADVRR